MARKRRTKGQIAQLERQILEAVKQDHPTSARHVFYLMTDPRLEESVEKSEKGYQQICTRLRKMRRAGEMPYGWICDESRAGWHVYAWSSAEEFLVNSLKLFRFDIWQHVNDYVEVWCESRSIAGVVQGVCCDLAVSLYPTGGFSSISLVHQAVSHWSTLAGGRDVNVIYIGDHDPSGVLIDESLEREMRLHMERQEVEYDLDFQRVAVTTEQIAAWDLPTKPRKKTDRRRWDITDTVEAEAIPATRMRAMVRSAISEFLSPGELERAKLIERAVVESGDPLEEILSEADYNSLVAPARGIPR